MQQPVSSPRKEIDKKTCETIFEESQASKRHSETIFEESQPSKRDSDTIFEESQASKRDIQLEAKQLEGVLNFGEKDLNRDKPKRHMSHPKPHLTQPKTAETEKDPALNAHAIELRRAVEPRREKDKDKGMMARGTGKLARGAEKLGKIRKSIHAFSNYGKGGQVTGSNLALIIRCYSISST